MEERLFERMKIEGTSMDLEKPYYRLTEVPDPADVRPEYVLKKSLANVVDKFRRGECTVHFVVDQFRSIRLVAPAHQDMKIQRIHNAFTVEVYEKNCLFCLKHGVLDQFNQCLLQLYQLYRDEIPGNKHVEPPYAGIRNVQNGLYGAQLRPLRPRQATKAGCS